jgi:uncharacterized membrane protein YbjE (DUF340 family)
MKGSLLIFLVFVAGLSSAAAGLLPGFLLEPDLTLYALYLLLFLVGITVGGSSATGHVLRRVNWKIALVPLSIIGGTFLGTALSSLLIPALTLPEALAVGAGFGYYSLSSVMISQAHSETLAVVALLANLIREMVTLLLAPLLARYAGRLAPIAAAGATALDTTLPIITQVSGKEYGVVAVFSGLVLTVLVPIFIVLILGT